MEIKVHKYEPVDNKTPSTLLYITVNNKGKLHQLAVYVGIDGHMFSSVGSEAKTTVSRRLDSWNEDKTHKFAKTVDV
jgi:hypothetical protein